jgi:hypothetical protein
MMVRTARFLPLLALAACAAEPADQGMAPVSSRPVSSPTAAASSGPWGKWVVTDVFAAGPGDTGAGRLVGQEVALDPAASTEVGGRTCTRPIFRNSVTSEADFLGSPARAMEFPALGRTVLVTEITCGGTPFARYGHWRDGSMMTRVGPAVLRLERAAAIKLRPVAAPVSVEPVAPPPPVTPVPHQHHANPAPMGERQVYLASYLGDKAARKGWSILTAKSPTLAALQPETVAIDLGAKGKFLRLFAKGADDAQASAVCAELKVVLPGCGHKP